MADRKGYRQFCPVAKAAEVVAERWTFLVIRELLSGSTRFNDLRRGLAMMSPSLLSQRLKELERAGVIDRKTTKGRKGAEYILTEAGEGLRPIIEGLGVWGLKWAHNKITKEDLDPGLLMWDIRRGMQTEHLPEGRIVIEFDFGAREKKKRLWWLVITDGEADLCITYPGYEIDVTVKTDMKTLSNVWLRCMEPKDAIRAGKIELDGPALITKKFHQWLGKSAIAEAAAHAPM